MLLLNLLEITRNFRAFLIVRNHIKHAKKKGAKELKFFLCPDNKLCRFEIDGAFFGDMKSNLNLQIINVIEVELKKDLHNIKVGKARYEIEGNPNKFIFDSFTFILK